jgi:hypothetical protein
MKIDALCEALVADRDERRTRAEDAPLNLQDAQEVDAAHLEPRLYLL